MSARVSDGDRIQVSVRFRPPNRQERAYSAAHPGAPPAVAFDGGGDGRTCRTVDPHRERAVDWEFNRVLPPGTSQNSCYRQVAAPLVEAVLGGLNAACIAYGQTGSGKTHTMFGPGFDEVEASAGRTRRRGGGRLNAFAWNCPPAEFGVIPRLFDDIFARARLHADRVQCELECSFVQLYNEKATDLITGLQLRVRQNADGDFETNALMSPLDSTADLLALVREGLGNRVTASTEANAQSSRSHAILTTRIMQRHLDTGRLSVSTLDLVDLAGSEKVSKTGASGDRLVEAGSINKSLFALSNVIEKLSQAERTASAKKAKRLARFVPYRDSILTRLLKNTLGGNSVTALLVCCSPHAYNLGETWSSLAFGSRAKSITNRPVKNEKMTVADLKVAIARATATLARQKGEIRRRQREICLHRRLVQAVLSRVPAGSPMLQDIFKALPLLQGLPRVKRWGDVYIPEFLMAHIFEMSGMVGMLKGCLVSKGWLATLSDPEWDARLWERTFKAEAAKAAAEAEQAPADLKKGEAASWRTRAAAWWAETQRARLDKLRSKFRETERKVAQGGNLVLLS